MNMIGTSDVADVSVNIGWNPTYNLKTYSGRSFAALNHYFWILYPNLSKIQHHLTLLNVDSKSIFSWVLITADADFYCFIVVLRGGA